MVRQSPFKVKFAQFLEVTIECHSSASIWWVHQCMDSIEIVHFFVSAGNCGNSFSSANGKRFSTVDQDNDNSPKSCAQKFKSGWWHGRCHQSSLNGLYFLGSSSDPYHFASGITWYTWKGYSYSLSKSEMKIRIW